VETNGKISAHSKTKVGPLDIDKRTRWGILAGIWTATFLSVSSTQYSLYVGVKY
jgi:hypothetical protein